MSLEEKVLAYRKLAEEIVQLEAEKKILSKEILLLMPPAQEKIQVANLQVKRYSRLYIKTSVEVAKTFGATKIEEVVDKAQIQKLLSQGILIPDVTESTFVIVSKLIREKAPIEWEN